MGWTNYIDDAVRGFGSVADDIARSQMGRQLSQGFIDDVAGQVSRNLPKFSASEAAEVMAEAQDDAARWYANFVAKNSMTPEDAINIPYRIGRGAAHTGQFAREHSGTALNLGMNAMFLAPMAMQMFPRSQEEQMYG